MALPAPNRVLPGLPVPEMACSAYGEPCVRHDGGKDMRASRICACVVFDARWCTTVHGCRRKQRREPSHSPSGLVPRFVKSNLI